MAQDYGYKETANRAGYQQGNAFEMINLAVSAILALTAIAFLGVCLYGGIRWITARGNDELTTKAKHALEAGAIGIILVTMAYALSNWILGKLIK